MTISSRWQWYLSGRSTSVHWSNIAVDLRPPRKIRSPHITQASSWVTGGRCRWCDMLQMLLLLPRCPVIRVTGSVRYTKYFYRSTLFSDRICYGPVSVYLFITSRSPAYNSRLQRHARIYAHSRWRCLNVLPFALQKRLDRSTAKPQTDSDTR